MLVVTTTTINGLMAMPENLPDVCVTASQAARELTATLGREVRPGDITQLFYRRILSDAMAPVIQGRRAIHRDLLPVIANALRRKGWIGRPVEKPAEPAGVNR